MSRGHTLVTVILASLLIAITSCKEKDEERPQVAISFPGDGASYSVKDTILVGIEASDNVNLELVQAKLTDQEGRLSSTIASAHPESRSYTGTLSIIIEDKYLASGSYWVNVKVSDGDNERSTYVSVNVVEFPRERRAIVALTGSANVSVQRVDSLGSIAPLISLGHDGSAVCINNRQDQALVIGDIDGTISSVDLVNGGLEWENTWPDQPPAPAFSAATCDDSDLLISAYGHLILGYDEFGSLILNKETTVAYRPEEIVTVGEQIIVEQRQSGTTDHFMFYYNRASAAVQNQILVPMDVVAICPFDEVSVLIFGNDNGQARVFQYSFFENAIWEPRTLEPGTVIDAVKSNGNTYFIAQSDGIYAYTFSPNFLNHIVPSVVSTGLRFDTDRGVLLSSSSNEIQEYSGSGTLIATHQFPEDVVSFDLHYTK